MSQRRNLTLGMKTRRLCEMLRVLKEAQAQEREEEEV